MSGFNSRWGAWTPRDGTDRTDKSPESGPSVSFGSSPVAHSVLKNAQIRVSAAYLYWSMSTKLSEGDRREMMAADRKLETALLSSEGAAKVTASIKSWESETLAVFRSASRENSSHTKVVSK